MKTETGPLRASRFGMSLREGRHEIASSRAGRLGLIVRTPSRWLPKPTVQQLAWTAEERSRSCA